MRTYLVISVVYIYLNNAHGRSLKRREKYIYDCELSNAECRSHTFRQGWGIKYTQDSTTYLNLETAFHVITESFDIKGCEYDNFENKKYVS